MREDSGGGGSGGRGGDTSIVISISANTFRYESAAYSACKSSDSLIGGGKTNNNMNIASKTVTVMDFSRRGSCLENTRGCAKVKRRATKMHP